MSLFSLNWCEIPELFSQQDELSGTSTQVPQDNLEGFYLKDDWKHEQIEDRNRTSFSAMDLENLSLTEYLYNLGNDQLDSSSSVLTNSLPSPPSDTEQKFISAESMPEKQKYPWTRAKLKPSSLNEQIQVMEERRKRDALAAKQNREKKKKYVTELEQSVDRLKKENTILKKNEAETLKAVEDLRSQVSYLKSVIANQSQLAIILNSLSSASGLNLCSSALQIGDELPRKKSRGEQGEAIPTGKSDNAKRGYDKPTEDCTMGNPAGVCLHVTQNKVSLEFCGSCSKMASTALPIEKFEKKENQS